MTLSAALEEAYAHVKAGERIIETLEIDHPGFDVPLRFVNVGDGDAADMDLPLSIGGTPVTFAAARLKFIRPGFDDDGHATPARLIMDNVAGVARAALEIAVQSDDPITVIFREYALSDLTQPGDVIDGLGIWNVEMDPVSATATLQQRTQAGSLAFPRATYDETYYPGLQST